MGLIVRTAGLNKTKNELNKDVINTINTWDQIKEKAMTSIAPALVYEVGDIIKRALRDLYDNDTQKIVIEGNEAYQRAKNFTKTLKNTLNIPSYKRKENAEKARKALDKLRPEKIKKDWIQLFVEVSD